MMTEAEAREKWCPMARAVLVDDDPVLPAHNRQCSMAEQQEGRADCIASQCAMWRWEFRTTRHGVAVAPSKHGYESDEPERGYCGLAGKP